MQIVIKYKQKQNAVVTRDSRFLSYSLQDIIEISVSRKHCFKKYYIECTWPTWRAKLDERAWVHFLLTYSFQVIRTLCKTMYFLCFYPGWIYNCYIFFLGPALRRVLKCRRFVLFSRCRKSAILRRWLVHALYAVDLCPSLKVTHGELMVKYEL